MSLVKIRPGAKKKEEKISTNFATEAVTEKKVGNLNNVLIVTFWTITNYNLVDNYPDKFLMIKTMIPNQPRQKKQWQSAVNHSNKAI